MVENNISCQNSWKCRKLIASIVWTKREQFRTTYIIIHFCSWLLNFQVFLAYRCHRQIGEWLGAKAYCQIVEFQGPTTLQYIDSLHLV